MAIVGAAVRCGFCKFRLTGGEPLVRKGICGLIGNMAAMPGVGEVVLTTNGVLLEEMARDLYVAGLRRLNISLDTLNPIKFRKITQTDHQQRILKGIRKARTMGFHPIKINMVVMRGVNDDELKDVARWAIQEGLTVRFIEYMPIGSRHRWDAGKLVTVDDMRRCLERWMPLQPISRKTSDGPAKRYGLGTSRTEIGFIGAVSHHFCRSCNRLRLTPEGKLRPCLHKDDEIDIKTPLRSGCSEEKLMDLIQTAVGTKIHHRPPNLVFEQEAQRSMSSIGG
jgi:cyclic pyranopterin phosphate synthase